jgi:hypothetical protein
MTFSATLATLGCGYVLVGRGGFLTDGLPGTGKPGGPGMRRATFLHSLLGQQSAVTIRTSARR